MNRENLVFLSNVAEWVGNNIQENKEYKFNEIPKFFEELKITMKGFPLKGDFAYLKQFNFKSHFEFLDEAFKLCELDLKNMKNLKADDKFACQAFFALLRACSKTE